MLADLVTQRWGVGSTRLHLDAERLAVGVLLFDRIVLPTPADEAEANRWDRLGWDTEAHAQRIVQLGELVHFAPWDATMRADWRARMEHIKKIGQDARGLAYSMTPMVIAQTGWNDVMASVGVDHRPRIRPVPIVWAAGPRSVLGHGAAQPAGEVPTSLYEEVTALKFRRVLEEPTREHPEETLDAVMTLASTTDFQDARRALYTAEALAAAGQLTPQEFGARLDSATARYNEVVAEYAGATRRRVIHHVVPFGVGQVLNLTQLPGSGAAGRWSAQRVVGRLLPLPPAPQPAQDEGAALALVERAMSAVWVSRGTGLRGAS
jgi:hypothetical protein